MQQPANENKRSMSEELFNCFKVSDPVKQLEMLKRLTNKENTNA